MENRSKNRNYFHPINSEKINRKLSKNSKITLMPWEAKFQRTLDLFVIKDGANENKNRAKNCENRKPLEKSFERRYSRKSDENISDLSANEQELSKNISSKLSSMKISDFSLAEYNKNSNLSTLSTLETEDLMNKTRHSSETTDCLTRFRSTNKASNSKPNLLKENITIIVDKSSSCDVLTVQRNSFETSCPEELNPDVRNNSSQSILGKKSIGLAENKENIFFNDQFSTVNAKNKNVADKIRLKNTSVNSNEAFRNLKPLSISKLTASIEAQNYEKLSSFSSKIDKLLTYGNYFKERSNLKVENNDSKGEKIPKKNVIEKEIFYSNIDSMKVKKLISVSSEMNKFDRR